MKPFGFIAHTSQWDWPLCDRLMREVRLHHPSVPMTVIGDGVNPPELVQLAKSLNIRFIAGDRFKTRRLGAQWLRRYFTTALELETRVVIEMDPDARIHRPVNSRKFPKADYFGHWDVFTEDDPPLEFIRGGCRGIRRSLFQTILESGLIDDPRYREAKVFTYDRRGKYRWPWEAQSNALEFAEDKTIAHLASRLGLTLAPWKEVWDGFRELPSQEAIARCAMTHPHPLLEKDNEKLCLLGRSHES